MAGKPVSVTCARLAARPRRRSQGRKDSNPRVVWQVWNLLQSPLCHAPMDIQLCPEPEEPPFRVSRGRFQILVLMDLYPGSASPGWMLSHARSAENGHVVPSCCLLR